MKLNEVSASKSKLSRSVISGSQISSFKKTGLIVMIAVVILAIGFSFLFPASKKGLAGRAFGETVGGPSIPLTSCGLITAPGVYTLNTVLSVADSALSNNACVTITVDNVGIRCTAGGGFTFTGSNPLAKGVRIMNVNGVEGVKVTGCQFLSFPQRSIEVEGSSGIVLNDNVIIQSGSMGQGISLSASQRLLVDKNKISAPIGLAMDSTTESVVSRNIIRAAQTGISVGQGSSMNSFFENTVSGRQAGITVAATDKNDFYLNVISGSPVGISFSGSTNTGFGQNTLCGNFQNGVACTSTPPTTFSGGSGNFLTGNSCSSLVGASFSDCPNPAVTLCGNSWVDNGEQCDDGNTVGNDGCSSTCQNEQPSFSCATSAPNNADPCANRANPTTDNTPNVLFATCPTTNVPACSYSCRSNFRLNAGVCEAVPAGLLGDVNRDTFVDSDDSLLIKRFEVGLITLTIEQQRLGNVNHCQSSTETDSDDALIIERLEVGLITGLPCT